LSWTARPVGWSPNCHKFSRPRNLAGGGLGPYRAVEPLMMMMMMMYSIYFTSQMHNMPGFKPVAGNKLLFTRFHSL
jgi:hypothetical protein